MKYNDSRLQFINPIHLLALGLGSGLSPLAPGTVGSLAALSIWYYLLAHCSWSLYGVLVCFAALIGIFICGRTAREMGVSDPAPIVWDEFVGLWISLMGLPNHQWQWVAGGFCLFRLFDICKPWPIYLFDRHCSGGLGIMLDDIVAGCMTALSLWLLGIELGYSHALFNGIGY